MMLELEMSAAQYEKLVERAKLYHGTVKDYVHLLIEIEIEPVVDPIKSLKQGLEDVRAGRVYPLCPDDDASPPTSNRDNQRIQVELTPQERSLLEERAQPNGMSLEQYIRRLIEDDLAETDPQEYLREVFCDPQDGQVFSLTTSDDAQQS